MTRCLLDPETFDLLERQAFDYFVHEANPANGLVADKTQEGAPASIAAIGLALAAYPVGVERAFMTRAEAVERTLAALRFFRNSPQGTQAEATGYKGFYYHFLDMTTGRRVWKCAAHHVESGFFVPEPGVEVAAKHRRQAEGFRPAERFKQSLSLPAPRRNRTAARERGSRELREKTWSDSENE